MPSLRQLICVVICAVAPVPLTAAEHTTDSLKSVQENIAAEKAVLVDVRETSEWDSGHLEGAIMLPLSELKDGVTKDELAERLPAEKVIYAHCASGRRCLVAAEILEKLGYDVRPLKSGYQDLLDAGFQKAEE